MIHLSEAAAGEIKRLQSSRNQPDSCLRLGVKAGGCSGLLYTIKLESVQIEGDPEGIRYAARIFYHNNITIIADKKSYEFLKDLKLDYSEDLMGGGFRFRNPKATNTCSCGQSFST